MEEALTNDTTTLIEDYPNDKYGPSCLLLGYTQVKRALHVQTSYSERVLIKIITLYQPNPKIWKNDQKRIVLMS